MMKNNDMQGSVMVMEIGTATLIIIAAMMLLITLATQVRDYLGRRDDRSRWRADVDTDRRDFKSFMNEIRDELGRIHSRIDDIFGRLGGPATLRTESPIQLTDLGQSISEKIGASDWAAKHAEKLSDRVADFPAYDIQELAFTRF